MSTPISAMTEIASGLTRVASVPALNTSKRSPARRLNNPSAIWERAELWVHKNRTRIRFLVRPSANFVLVTIEMARGLAEELPRGLPVEGVEGPPPAPLLAHQPSVLELPHVVGDLRLAHAEGLLELADADALLSLARWHSGDGEVAASAAVGHHAEHPHPDGVRKGTAQGDEPLHPFLGVTLLGDVATHAVLFDDPDPFGSHGAPRSDGLRPLMKALASGTSVDAVAATVSSQQPEPPQQPEPVAAPVS